MNGLIKALMTMAPVFIICLVIYLNLNEKFDFEFERESLRFEQQFDQAAGFEGDKWLKEQEKNLDLRYKHAQKASDRLRQLQIDLDDSLAHDNVTVSNLTKDMPLTP